MSNLISNSQTISLEDPIYPSGLPKQRLSNDKGVIDLLECMLCQNILYKPEECVKCQRSFCQTCIIKWKKSSQQCPSGCRQFQTQKCHKITRNLLGRLQFKCCNSKLGCEELLSSEHLESHEKNCQFKLVQCPAHSDCGFKGIRQKIDEHIKECGFVKIRCPECYQPKMKSILDEHLKVCDFKTVECVAYQKCHSKVYLKDLKKHESMCDFVIVTCEKCQLKQERALMVQHKCTTYMWQQVNLARQQHNELLKKREQLRHQLSDTKKKQQDEGIMLKFVMLIIFILTLFQWYDSFIGPRITFFKTYFHFKIQLLKNLDLKQLFNNRSVSDVEQYIRQDSL